MKLTTLALFALIALTTARLHHSSRLALNSNIQITCFFVTYPPRSGQELPHSRSR